MLEKIKRSQIYNAAKVQRAYDSDNGRPGSLHNARGWIQEHLERTFSEFPFEGTGREAYVKIRICSVHNPTDCSIEKFVEENMNLWTRTLIEGLCRALKRLGAVRVRSRRDYPDDQQMIGYLGNEALAEVIGSEFVFRTREFRNREQITDILKSKTCVLGDSTQSALLLKKAGVRIYIQNVRIGVHSAVMRDCSVTQKGRSYRLSSIDGIELDFTKEELEKFLHDSRKVYDILYDVAIRRDAGIIGDVFYSD